MPPARSARPWWQTGVVYQVYPRSFQDSGGDGVGDLGGIAARLDHLAWLGVDAVWLSPFYPSPMADFGYDVADYCDVDPLFGDLDAFDRLVVRAHGLGLRVIVDWVPNHSSDQHPWFGESRRGRQSPRRDWYVWRDARPGPGPPHTRPPNNWLSAFGGPAWTWDPASGQFFLHSFLPQQPDLNWRHAPLREAMSETLRFWMRRGVDGFRIDVANHVLKDPALRDNPPNPRPSGGHKPTSPYDRQTHLHDRDHPDAHALFRDIRALVDNFAEGSEDGKGGGPRERVLLGEIHLSHDLARWAGYFGGGDGGAPDEVHLPLNFGLLGVPWTAEGVGAHVQAVEAALPPGAWPSYVLGSHDEARLASRVGPEGVRLAAVLLLTLRGTPTLYNGDEIGTPTVDVPLGRRRDPAGLRTGIPGLGRDGGRTPLAWDASPSAGFSPAPPHALWLPLHPGHAALNVAAQRDDPASLLRLYRRLLRLRRVRPALHAGTYQAWPEAAPEVLAFVREGGGDRAFVALNFGPSEAEVRLPEAEAWAVLASTHGPAPRGSLARGGLRLRPSEGVVLGARGEATSGELSAEGA